MKIFIILLISLPLFVKAQKVNSYTYKNVDTVHQYDDGQIITYKDKNGNIKIDTIYYNLQKRNLIINKADEVIINEGEILKKEEEY